MKPVRKVLKKLFCERGRHFVSVLSNWGGEVGELTSCPECEQKK